MEDVFLSDPRQTSAKEMSIKKQLRKTSKRRFRHYLFDFIIKSLIISSLISINFTLFAEAGGYNLFNISRELTSEAYWIYIAIIVCSASIMFVLSFSQTLENIVIAIISAIFTFALLHQFALFDINSFLLQYADFIPHSYVDIIGTFSHIICSTLVFIIAWLIITLLSRRTQFYLFLLLVLVEGGLLFDAYFNQVSRNFETKAFLNDESNHPKSQNIVFITLPNAPTYSKLKSLDLKGQNPEIKQAADNVLGFYLQNNFTYYPNAYLHNLDLPFINLTEHLNLNHSDNMDNLLLSEIIVNGYWDFKHIRQEKLYLRQNRLFSDLHQKDYNLRVYQGRGIELCTINNNLSVNRCLQKINYPINLNNNDLKFGQKVSLLTAQWLESTGLFSGINPILGIFSAFNSEVSPLRFSATELTSFNAFSILDIIADDITQDRGNNLYFTILDLPSELYMYDSLCTLKPVSRWISSKDKSTNLAMQQTAYAEQVSCLYGKLENFIRTLKNNNKLSNTTIIIDGISSAFPAVPGIEKDIFKSIQNSKQAGLAIYNNTNPQASIDTRMCLSSSIIREHFKQDQNCLELEDLSITETIKENILKKAKEQALNNQITENARKNFNNWYQTWAAYNQIELQSLEDTVPLEKTPKISETPQEINIEPVKTSVAEELPPEVETQSLPTSNVSQPQESADQIETSNSMIPEKKPENTETISQPETLSSNSPLSKPEQLKKEFRNKQEQQSPTITEPSSSQVNVEVKVIENSPTKDVVPPFVLGEIKYQDTEETN